MGSLTTVYDTGNFLRSYNANILGATVLTVAGNTLSYQIVPVAGQINRMFEVRVVTLVPGPGPIGLAAMGSVLAFRRVRR